MSDAGPRTFDPPSNPDAGSLSSADLSLLAVFRKFMVGPGEMLCFFGPVLDKHRPALTRLTERGLLVKERFRGGYALTATGFDAMLSHARQLNSSAAESEAGGTRNEPLQRRRAHVEKRRQAGRRA